MARKKQFKAESKRLLDLMINSIYTHKEIFLRELISNASDAIDKYYYEHAGHVSPDEFSIRIEANKEARTLTITDNGIGMNKEELEENLGTIAKSGSLAFKEQIEDESKSDVDIIGQFGVGFYSAFMVAKDVVVISKKDGEDMAYRWQSDGESGYTIEEAQMDSHGSQIILTLKEDTDNDKYSQYLETYELKELVRKYSDYIRYPIKMNVETSKIKEETKDSDKPEYETVIEDQTLNSMVPLWKRQKSQITPEEYNQFYKDHFFDYQDPQRVIHFSVEGNVSFTALLYIPSHVPQGFYNQDYKKGLQLYCKGVFIMDHAEDLLPDSLRFVKGLVDSQDLSLNISREMLQHDRQLKLIESRLEKKIKSELKKMLTKDREKYEKFFDTFGLQLKIGIYQSYGMLKDKLQDLLLFYSGNQEKMITLKEYVENMKEGQTEIYFGSGENKAKISALPQVEAVKDRGYDVLYMMDNVDEFMIQMMRDYDSKPFKNVAQGDLNLESEEEKKELEKVNEENKSLLDAIKEALKDQVVDVKVSHRLKSHPVCLVSDQGVSFEMEKVLNAMPDGQNVKAGRILEINPHHDIFKAMQNVQQNHPEKINDYASILYDQALLIEGFSIDNPVEFSNKICDLMIQLNK